MELDTLGRLQIAQCPLLPTFQRNTFVLFALMSPQSRVRCETHT